MTFLINGIDASFGSQGQHRSLVLSIKLEIGELMVSITKESQILLLDDVMSGLTIPVNLRIVETIFSPTSRAAITTLV